MPGLPFQESAFLESKGREYSPFRNSFPASLKGGQEGGKEGTRCRRLRICTHRGTVVNMHASWYYGVVHGTMHASCTWNYGRGAGEVMRACTLAKLYFHLLQMEEVHFHFEKMEEARFLHIVQRFSMLLHQAHQTCSGQSKGVHTCLLHFHCFLHARLGCFGSAPGLHKHQAPIDT